MPGLCTILVGEDPASQIYVRSKAKASIEAGFASFEEKLPAASSEAELLALIARLNRDERIDGILVQLPLPPQIDRQRVIDTIDPAKDVDGFHVENVGGLWSGAPALLPCTPYGCLLLLREAMPKLSGAEAVVIGRSNLVGKPMAALAAARRLHRDARPFQEPRDLPEITRRADILVVAVGHAELVRGAWLKPGAVVIDVGINRVDVPRREVADRRRCCFRRGAGYRRGDHPRAGRRRADDHRLPAAQHAAGRLRPPRPAATADLTKEKPLARSGEGPFRSAKASLLQRHFDDAVTRLADALRRRHRRIAEAVPRRVDQLVIDAIGTQTCADRVGTAMR